VAKLPLHTYFANLFCSIRYDTPTATEECLTCSMPESCRYTSARFSHNANYYMLYCHGPDIPVYYLRSSHNATAGQHDCHSLNLKSRSTLKSAEVNTIKVLGEAQHLKSEKQHFGKCRLFKCKINSFKSDVPTLIV